MATAETAVINWSSLGPETVRQKPFRIMVKNIATRGQIVNKDKLSIERNCIELKRDSSLDS